MTTDTLGFEEIKRWMANCGIKRFQFEKQFKVTIAELARGFKDEVIVCGMYAAGDTIFVWGDGVTNLKFADKVLIEAIIKNLPQ